MKSQLAQVKTTTAEIDRWKERFLDMRILIVFVASAFGVSAASVGKWIAIELGWG
ncbi:hypothetical protein MUO32_06175 [Shinella sp. CPCC 101442]|uniref:hypothetical protein n=1 Tax=Shinella sp. CPCC 101442 TaxID=2932265 RepID=UPI0021538815|nr:hypothetical protein [Shinella sp. CPCC 101442]MCR6498608.1 hypothetical protein [Shinella sp. CPCC 101442]